MLFTEPCCQVLKHCLQFGDDRTFYKAGDTGPLMVRTASSVYQARGVQERQLFEQAVIFCPFCGKRLQTADAVERYFKG
jgi:hypothetical protein